MGNANITGNRKTPPRQEVRRESTENSTNSGRTVTFEDFTTSSSEGKKSDSLSTLAKEIEKETPHQHILPHKYPKTIFNKKNRIDPRSPPHDNQNKKRAPFIIQSPQEDIIFYKTEKDLYECCVKYEVSGETYPKKDTKKFFNQVYKLISKELENSPYTVEASFSLQKIGEKYTLEFVFSTTSDDDHTTKIIEKINAFFEDFNKEINNLRSIGCSDWDALFFFEQQKEGFLKLCEHLKKFSTLRLEEGVILWDEILPMHQDELPALVDLVNFLQKLNLPVFQNIKQRLVYDFIPESFRVFLTQSLLEEEAGNHESIATRKELERCFLGLILKAGVNLNVLTEKNIINIELLRKKKLKVWVGEELIPKNRVLCVLECARSKKGEIILPQGGKAADEE